MSAHKGFIIVDSATNMLLSAPMMIMKESIATKVASDLGGNAIAVQLQGMAEPWNPTAEPAQSWVYDPVTKVLNTQTP